MSALTSWMWSFWMVFFCWCAVAQAESKRVTLVDHLASHIDIRSPNKGSYCKDSKKNHDETDVDCGGSICPKCDNGMRCKDNYDCASNTCRDKQCTYFESCDDDVKNQDETDVDCGGMSCQPCDIALTCHEHRDCISGICKRKKCVAVESCEDNIKNQDESDVDCGGIHCPRCEAAKTCKAGCDCISDSCINNTCAGVESCVDGIKNQDETDVDCGGDRCPKCDILKECESDCDCHHALCKDHICVPICTPACQNNGTCTIYRNCSCPPGFTGVACEVQSVGLCHDNETLGVTPILLVTFDSGRPQYSRQRPANFNFSTTYKQGFEPTTNDGMFSFVNAIHDDFDGTWHTNALDHTDDDDGYMLLVNADYQPGEFYKGQVNNLCVGLRYEFSVYLANICTPPDRIEPNVRFEVRSPSTGNRLLAQLRSGEIPVHSTLQWNKYGLSFVAPSSSVVLLMISDARGGMGNDIVIDDIALRVCSHKGSGFCPEE